MSDRRERARRQLRCRNYWHCKLSKARQQVGGSPSQQRAPGLLSLLGEQREEQVQVGDLLAGVAVEHLWGRDGDSSRVCPRPQAGLTGLLLFGCFSLPLRRCSALLQRSLHGAALRRGGPTFMSQKVESTIISLVSASRAAGYTRASPLAPHRLWHTEATMRA